jgi:hypothetical protein
MRDPNFRHRGHRKQSKLFYPPRKKQNLPARESNRSHHNRSEHRRNKLRLSSRRQRSGSRLIEWEPERRNLISTALGYLHDGGGRALARPDPALPPRLRLVGTLAAPAAGASGIGRTAREVRVEEELWGKCWVDSVGASLLTDPLR